MFPILDQRGNVIGFGGRVIGQRARPEVPQLARNAAVRERTRTLRPAPGARQAIRDARHGDRRRRLHGRGRPGPARRRQTPWRRSARRPPATTCTSCCARPIESCSASTAMPPAARRRGARWRPAWNTSPTTRASPSCSCRRSTTPTASCASRAPTPSGDWRVRPCPLTRFPAAGTALARRHGQRRGAIAALLHEAKPLCWDESRRRCCACNSRDALADADPRHARRKWRRCANSGRCRGRHAAVRAAPRRAPPTISRTLLKIVLQKPGWAPEPAAGPASPTDARRRGAAGPVRRRGPRRTARRRHRHGDRVFPWPAPTSRFSTKSWRNLRPRISTRQQWKPCSTMRSNSCAGSASHARSLPSTPRSAAAG